MDTVTPTQTNTPSDTPTPTITVTPTATFSLTPNSSLLTPSFTLSSTPYPADREYLPYPNPADMTEPLSFYYSVAPNTQQVKLKIFTTAFRKIFEDEQLPNGAGQHLYKLDWDKTRLNIANGLYFGVIYFKSDSGEIRKAMKILIRR